MGASHVDGVEVKSHCTGSPSYLCNALSSPPHPRLATLSEGVTAREVGNPGARVWACCLPCKGRCPTRRAARVVATAEGVGVGASGQGVEGGGVGAGEPRVALHPPMSDGARDVASTAR